MLKSVPNALRFTHTYIQIEVVFYLETKNKIENEIGELIGTGL